MKRRSCIFWIVYAAVTIACVLYAALFLYAGKPRVCTIGSPLREINGAYDPHDIVINGKKMTLSTAEELRNAEGGTSDAPSQMVEILETPWKSVVTVYLVEAGAPDYSYVYLEHPTATHRVLPRVALPLGKRGDKDDLPEGIPPQIVKLTAAPEPGETELRLVFYRMMEEAREPYRVVRISLTENGK